MNNFLYEIIQVTKRGESVHIIRDTVDNSNLASTKRAMLAGIEDEQFVIRRISNND